MTMIVYSQSQFLTSKGNQITLPAGSTSVIVPVPASKHGRIYRVLVKQASGTSTGFTLNVVDTDTTVSGAPSLDLCRIIAPISVSAGAVGAYYSEHGVAFRNKNNDPYFYLLISVGSAPSSPLTFEACVTWSAAES